MPVALAFLRGPRAAWQRMMFMPSFSVRSRNSVCRAHRTEIDFRYAILDGLATGISIVLATRRSDGSSDACQLFSPVECKGALEQLPVAGEVAAVLIAWTSPLLMLSVGQQVLSWYRSLYLSAFADDCPSMPSTSGLLRPNHPLSIGKRSAHETSALTHRRNAGCRLRGWVSARSTPVQTYFT